MLGDKQLQMIENVLNSGPIRFVQIFKQRFYLRESSGKLLPYNHRHLSGKHLLIYKLKLRHQQ